MPNDFSDFNVDDIYYGVDEDDAPDAPNGGPAGEGPVTGGSEPAVGKETQELKDSRSTVSPKDTEDEVSETQTEGKEPGKASALMTLVQLVVILLLLAVVAAQIMGISYRDILEGRRETSSADRVFAGMNQASHTEKASQAPAAVSEVKQAEKTKQPEETKQVEADKASPASKALQSESTPEKESASAPEPKSASAKVQASPPEAAPAKTAAAAPSKARAKTSKPKTAEAPKAVGTHAVAVGIFRSQRHVVKLKQTLASLSLPSFTRVTQKTGEGFVLQTKSSSAAALKAAKAALADKGYGYEESDSELTAYFHYEDEAAKALALVSSAQTSAAVDKVIGNLPVWKVFAGPMDYTRAKAAAKELRKKKIDNYVLRLTK